MYYKYNIFPEKGKISVRVLCSEINDEIILSVFHIGNKYSADLLQENI